MVRYLYGKNPGEAIVELAADDGEVDSARVLEIPINGPREANRLVIITGIAVPSLDTDDRLYTRETIHIEFRIETGYKIAEQDSFLDGSAYVCLSSIQRDGDTEYRIAVEAAKVDLATSKVVRLIAFGAVGGDTALNKIGFQLNLLIRSGA